MVESVFGLGPEQSIFLVVIAIALGGLAIGQLIEYISVKFSERMGLSRQMRFGLERQLEKVGVSADIVGVFGKAMKYLVYLGTIFLIVETLDIKPFAEILRGALMFAPNIVAAMAIVIFGSIITEFATDVMKFSLKSNGVDSLLEESGVKFKISSTAASFVRYFLYSVILVVVLAQLGLEVLELNILLSVLWSAVVLTLMLFTVFSLKDMLPDIAAGLYIRNSQRLSAGDKISFEQIKGSITRVGFISTEVEVGKELAYIPNGRLLKGLYTVSRVPRKGPDTS
ncbi:MAG: mechanosensitive ion channel domain-containing protein [Candidatus Micrarchaeota archaeon]